MGFDGFPRRTCAERIEQLRRRMAREQVNAYWAVTTPNVRYLSGFTGDDSTLLIGAKRAVLITDSRYSEQAETEAQVDDILVRRSRMAREVAVLCRKLDCGKIAFSSRNVSFADYHRLRSELSLGDFVPCESGWVEDLRVRKDKNELAAVGEALRVAEEAFRVFSGEICPGKSENWLAARLEWEMRVQGAEGRAFETICACGTHASQPHAVATERVLRDDPLLVDWGATVRGYNSDLTRVVAGSTMPEGIEELSEVVLQAQEAAFEKLEPGLACAEVDQAARSAIVRAGYGRFFGHGLGHGVGLEVHEAPRVAPGEEAVLLPGMVFTIEPGIYIPGKMGVRIEEMVVITGDGFVKISALPSEMLEAQAWG
ncbi:MAG: aminopeptidase P family protein [Planctomycetes bacterium]|nr:aminopeptidase P family protein [Planctomycetota bacterium]